jgi:hypothetical protein
MHNKVTVRTWMCIFKHFSRVWVPSNYKCDLDLEGRAMGLCQDMMWLTFMPSYFKILWCMTKLQPGHECVYLLILIVIMWNFKWLRTYIFCIVENICKHVTPWFNIYFRMLCTYIFEQQILMTVQATCAKYIK